MKNKTLKKIFIPLLMTGLLSITSNSFAKKEVTMEKCMGIAEVGMGDGKATINNKTIEWLYLPAGQCEKLIGGKIYKDK